jgi:hypothetical protein
MQENIFNELHQLIKEDTERELYKLEQRVDESTIDGDFILDEGRLAINNKQKRREEHLSSLNKGDFIPEDSSCSAEFVLFVGASGIGYVDEFGNFC